MKYMILLLALVSCTPDGHSCFTEYDTSKDQGECWKRCGQSAAASEYFTYNFNKCITVACDYPHKQVCK